MYLKMFFSFLLLISTYGINADNDQEKTFVQQFISRGDLVFDVGAHIGNKTDVYLTQGARVICIEPQPSCCKILESKFKNNPNVAIEQIGLANKPGILPLKISSGGNTLSTFSREWQEKSRHKERGYTWDTSINVLVQTLDSLIKKYGSPQFCKIDVENFEYEVLTGLSRAIPFLSFEFHVETLPNAIQCLNYLKSIGYQKFNVAAGEYPSFICNTWVSKDVLIEKILNYSVEYMSKENDPLWGDIYAKYP